MGPFDLRSTETHTVYTFNINDPNIILKNVSFFNPSIDGSIHLVSISQFRVLLPKGLKELKLIIETDCECCEQLFSSLFRSI